MNIGFLVLVAGLSLDLLFNHGTQRLGIHDLLAPNTLINALPNRDEASEISDLGNNHFLIVRRLEVVDEPLDHFIFHHGGLHLCNQLTPPLGILSKRFPALLFYPLENDVIGSYLGVEPIVF